MPISPLTDIVMRFYIALGLQRVTIRFWIKEYLYEVDQVVTEDVFKYNRLKSGYPVSKVPIRASRNDLKDIKVVGVKVFPPSFRRKKTTILVEVTT